MFDVIIVAFLLTCAIASLLTLAVLWRSVDTDWRLPPDHHRGARVAALLAVLWLVVAGALIVDAPWGSTTALYVLWIGGGLAIVAGLLTVTGQALRDIQRARTAPRQRLPSPRH